MVFNDRVVTMKTKVSAKERLDSANPSPAEGAGEGTPAKAESSAPKRTSRKAK